MGLLLKQALDQAAVWHRSQRRKYPDADVPYVSHLAGVAITLARHGFDEEVVAAGALHDVMEDQSVTFAELSERFGERVATLVRMVTEHDKSAPWEERKRRYLDAFPKKPWEAQAITLADKIDNFESIVVCARVHGDPWAMFKRGREVQMARFEELWRMCQELPGHALIEEFRVALEQVRRV
ncbi:MAG TPA: HD domain-containing protein [Candidatus Nanopelagicales bacterium]|nr:HD domain-containing protein [Candidatus Nanopelagicales bacterium]